MLAIVRAQIKKMFPTLDRHYKAYEALIKSPDSYLYSTGWLDSLMQARPMDSQGRPVPWMNYPVVRLLDQRLRSDMTLFEYGSGHSTAFYAARVAKVVSLEYDREWFDVVAATLPENAELMYQAQDVDGDYCRAITRRDERFDVVIVDGRDRVNCVLQSLDRLSERGVVLLDDSQRERYQPAVVAARERGFRALELEGLKPTGIGIDRSTILYRDGNCLGI